MTTQLKTQEIFSDSHKKNDNINKDIRSIFRIKQNEEIKTKSSDILKIILSKKVLKTVIAKP